MQIDMAGANLGAIAAAGVLAQNAEASKGFPKHVTGYVAEPKYDGWRIIAVIGHGKVDFYSRSGKTYNGKLPKVEAELLAALPVGTVIDGEAVALTNGKAWGTTQSVLTTHAHLHADKITYMVFDLLAHRAIDARSLSYDKRRALLERIFEAHDFAQVALTPQVPCTEESYKAALDQGFEGLVLKRTDAKYASDKRGHGWIKVKPFITVEGVVMGFQPGKSGFEGMVGAVIFGQYDESGVLVERGKCSGMNMKTRLDMTNNPDKWLGRVIEVAHEGVSIGSEDSGRFRFPRFKRERKDRSAESVVLHDA